MITYKRASYYSKRLLAAAIDRFIFAPVYLLILFIGFLADTYVNALLATIIISLWRVAFVIFRAACHDIHGATYGKILLGVKIVDINDSELSTKKSIKREIPNLFTVAIESLLVGQVAYMIEYGSHALPISFPFIIYITWISLNVLYILSRTDRRSISDVFAGTKSIDYEYGDKGLLLYVFRLIEIIRKKIYILLVRN